MTGERDATGRALERVPHVGLEEEGDPDRALVARDGEGMLEAFKGSPRCCPPLATTRTM
jgi:hypothetical protein